jgi:hypothetical protein
MPRGMSGQVKCKMDSVSYHMESNNFPFLNHGTLRSHLNRAYIKYLRLPIGAALPFITEVEE